MGAALKPQAPAVGGLFLHRGEMLVVVTTGPEFVPWTGMDHVSFFELTTAPIPVGGDFNENEWAMLEQIDEPVAGAILRAVAGAMPLGHARMLARYGIDLAEQ